MAMTNGDFGLMEVGDNGGRKDGGVGEGDGGNMPILPIGVDGDIWFVLVNW